MLGTCTLKRSEYVSYENDGIPPGGASDLRLLRNRRVSGTRTVYADDGDTYADVAYESFDGLGHYRISTTSGTFAAGNARRTEIDWNPDRGSFGTPSYDVLGVSEPWVLDTFTLTTTTDRTDSVLDPFPNDDATTRTESTFDPGTGYLRCRRVYATGIWPGAHDLLTVFTPSLDGSGKATGEVGEEGFFGGDRQAIGVFSAADPCDNAYVNGNAPEYRLTHTYAHGARTTTRHEGLATSFYELNLDIDANTGLATASRDTAGVETQYTYDSQARMVAAIPQSFNGLERDARTEVAYIQAGGIEPNVTPAEVATTRCPAPAACDGANQLARERRQYDGFGRIWRELRDLPDSVGTSEWAIRITRRDQLGQPVRSSTWFYGDGTTFPANENALPATVTSYDAFGRPTQVTTPDGKVTSRSYAGAQSVSTDQSVALSLDGNESCVRRRDTFDRLGRLFRVEEALAACSENAAPGSITEYGYDEGDRLSSVCQNKSAGGCGQQRSFDYDNRGFLRTEHHPEKGPSGNGTVEWSRYDSRGHAQYRDDGSTANRLQFDYDAAERLRFVCEQPDSGGACTTDLSKVWKIFDYDTSANGLGKLGLALRRNVVATSIAAAGFLKVSESYSYGGRQGRISTRTTRIDNLTDGAECWIYDVGYDPLGNVVTQSYPRLLRVQNDQCQLEVPIAPLSVAATYDEGFLRALPGWVDAIDYHPTGMPKTVLHANGLVEAIAADPSGMPRPASITATPPLGAPWSTGTYAYDGAGNIEAMGADRFRYDRSSRVVEANLASVAPATNQRYTFDVYGNITTVRTDGADKDLPTNAGTNRLTRADYDAAGNLRKNLDLLGVPLDESTFDRFNMMTEHCTSGALGLCGGEQWRYIYTADDERVGALSANGTHSTWTLRDLAGHLLTRDSRDRAGTPCLSATGIFCDGFESGSASAWGSNPDLTVSHHVEQFVWRGDLLVGVDDASGRRHFGLDHLGTVRAVTNWPQGGPAFGDRSSSTATGALVLHTYYPFGEEATGKRQDELVTKFTGHERDLLVNAAGVAADIDYMHARFYSHAAARFVTFDPVGGNPQQPQSWNRFAYVLGKPLTYVDPLGLEASDIQCTDSGCTVQVTAPALSYDAATLRAESLQYFGNGPRLGSREYADQVLSGAGLLSAPVAQGADLLAEGFNLYTGWIDLADALVSRSLPEIGLAVLFATIPGSVDNEIGAGLRLTGYTRHGINQAISREGVGVSARAILDAAKNPVRITQQSGGRVKLVGKEAVIILNRDGKVISTWSTTSSAWRARP